MDCTKCGALVPDDSDFCPECGMAIISDTSNLNPIVDGAGLTANAFEETKQERQAPDPDGKSQQEKPHLATAGSSLHTGDTACLVGIVAGILFTVAGLLIIIIASPGCETTSFGGDAYTFIYQGIVAIANSVALMARALGGCLAAVGVFMACSFWRKRCS